MKDLPLVARLYVAGVIAAGVAVAVLFLPQVAVDDPMLFVVLLLMSSVTSTLKVSLPLSLSGSTMSVSYAFDVASLLLLGPHPTMVVAAASAWSQCTFRMKERNPTYRTLFSMACLALTVEAAGFVYSLLGGQPRNLALTALAKPLVGAAATYFAINTITVATAIGLSTRQSILKVWNDNFLWSGPSYFVGALAAAIAAVLMERSGQWIAPVAVAPLYLTYRTYQIYIGRIEDEQRHLRQVSELHLATIEALARAIDAKDQTSQTHIRGVQSYAVALAEAAGLTDYGDLQSVKTAALLHDIGKLAVPEHILSKPGPLTQEEFQKIRMHPTVGADIVAAVPFPYPVAPLILCHHERWDGKGYPAGLKGEDIPIGARILAIADFFDALMADRPYHKAMSRDAAITLLKHEAGHALDPVLVDTFIALLPRLEGEFKHLAAAAAAAPELAPQEPPLAAPDASKKTVFEDIALAHREIYALYEIAQAMGTRLGVSDTMTLIASKLANLVPFSCCALFLYDDERDRLRCRFATGVGADRIRELEVASGEGLTRWVARNRRAVVDSRMPSDLDVGVLGDSPPVLQSALVAPLIFNERFIGTLSVFHTEPMSYRDDHRRLMDRVCEQAAAVINNSIVFEQTQEDSLTDPLTGLPNMRFLLTHLSGELARADRLNAQVALMVMDVDSFKDINDSHGHHVGDRVLCEIARVLRAAIRPYDICVRYAGDEFIVVLSACGGEEADAKRLTLQRAIEQVSFEPRPGKRLQLGVSIGVATFPVDGSSYEMLLAVADSRMYQDKTTRPRPGRRQRSVAVEQRPQLNAYPDTGLGGRAVASDGLGQAPIIC